MMKQLLTALALVTLMSGCAGEMAKPATAESAKAAIASAEAARKKASSVGGEWRDTAKMIKAADAAAKKGDFEAAVKQANKAREQGEMGYTQAVSQKELKMPSYLKY
ncbi:MAG: SoxXA-binding protein [Gammaproteobacteria bacterium]|nr:SoxXA-binding protein [Gammaproteobacteria bacterium]